jgi:hypothetical protein
MPATMPQIRAWSTVHLVNAASYWSDAADQWEDVFLQMRNQSYAIAWQGAGSDGLRQRTATDLSIVSGKADQLRQAGRIACNGFHRAEPSNLSPPAPPRPAPAEPVPVPIKPVPVEPTPVEPVPAEPPPSTGGSGRGSIGLGPEGGALGGMGGIGGGGQDLPFPGIAGEEPL